MTRHMIVFGLLVILTAQAADPHFHLEASHHAEICPGHLDGSDHGDSIAHARTCSACATTQRLRLLAVCASPEIVAAGGTASAAIALPEPSVAQPPQTASDSPRAPPLVQLRRT